MSQSMLPPPPPIYTLLTSPQKLEKVFLAPNAQDSLEIEILKHFAITLSAL